MMIGPTNIEEHNNKEDKKLLFTIQYTKEELDKIQDNFVEHMNNYIAQVNNRILKTMEEIQKEAALEKEAAIVPPTNIIENQEEEEVINK